MDVRTTSAEPTKVSRKSAMNRTTERTSGSFRNHQPLEPRGGFLELD